jgi:hypothetical protein
MRIVQASALALALLLAPASGSAADEAARWQPLENDPGCVVWNKGPQPQETVTWTGPCTDGKTHGPGVLVWRFRKNGAWTSSRYEGEMEAGKPHGHGAYAWPDGDRYEGDWRHGDRHGHGVYEWAGGDRYAGPFVGGKMHGIGTCAFSSGQSGACEWSHGELVRWVD